MACSTYIVASVVCHCVVIASMSQLLHSPAAFQLGDDGSGYSSVWSWRLRRFVE